MPVPNVETDCLAERAAGVDFAAFGEDGPGDFPNFRRDGSYFRIEIEVDQVDQAGDLEN